MTSLEQQIGAQMEAAAIITRLPVHDHHLLADEFRHRFSAEYLDIDINRYTITIDEGHHLGVIHGYNRNGYNEWKVQWNGKWRSYFDDKDNRHEKPTRLGIYRKVKNMMREYGLNSFEIHVYKSPRNTTDLDELLREG